MSDELRAAAESLVADFEYAEKCGFTMWKGRTLADALKLARGYLAERADRSEYPFVRLRISKGPDAGKEVVVDIYDIADSVGYRNAGQLQAIKKLLRGGRTGKDWETDMKEAIESIQRALERGKA